MILPAVIKNILKRRIICPLLSHMLLNNTYLIVWYDRYQIRQEVTFSEPRTRPKQSVSLPFLTGSAFIMDTQGLSYLNMSTSANTWPGLSHGHQRPRLQPPFQPFRHGPDLHSHGTWGDSVSSQTEKTICLWDFLRIRSPWAACQHWFLRILIQVLEEDQEESLNFSFLLSSY